jgi:Domain of unknown function (DUF3387)
LVSEWLTGGSVVRLHRLRANRASPRNTRMRVLVKHLLRKYGYPPDLQDAAVQKVLQQAEAFADSGA